MGHYKVREKELFFILKEQLKYGRLAEYDRYKDLNETAFDMLVKEGIKFAHGVVEPLEEPGEEFGVKLENGKAICLPAYKDAFKQFGEDGWIAVSRDTTYGGQGFPLMMRIVMNELFYGACDSFNVLPSLTHGAGNLIESFATQELKELFVPRMYAGEWSGAMVMTEPDAGSSLGGIQTEARRDGDHFKIKGNKIFISYGYHDAAENNINLLLARIQGAPEGVNGISLFIVPTRRVNADGSLGKQNDVKIQRVENKLGLHACPTAAMSFGDNDECMAYLCGEENKGLHHMFQLLNQGRINSSVSGMTMASSAFLNVLEYCKGRVQGSDLSKEKKGDVPLIEHPDIRRMLLWMKAVVEGLRSMIYLAAFYSDLAESEKDTRMKERYQLLLELMTPICKAYSTFMSFDVCSTAMQCMGGHGYMHDYPIEGYLRNVRGAALYEGTNGIQALDLLRRKIRMKGGAALSVFVEEVEAFINENKSHSGFSNELQLLETTLHQLNDVSLHLAARWDAEPAQAAAHCIPLLFCFGDVILAWRLLDMALISDKAISGKASKKSFYLGKIKAATYFVGETLPQTQARLSTRLAENRELLEIEPNEF